MSLNTIFALVLSFSHCAISNTGWDYNNIISWPDSYPICGALDESPININPLTVVDNHEICTSSFDWTVDYSKQTFKIANNGHTISLKAVDVLNFDGLSFDEIVGRRRMTDSTINSDNEEPTIPSDQIMYLDSNENTIATFPNYFVSKGSPHTKFCLDSFHFHWGKEDNYGSEHTVNNVHYPLEAHFVHYACDHVALSTTLSKYPTAKNVTDGIKRGDDVHVLGVVGVFFDVYDDKTNPAFDAIFNDKTFEHIKLPDHDSAIQTSEIVRNLDLSQLLPTNIATDGYYAYEGSLTTPPCTDIVRWYVMNAHGYIGRSQLEKFRALQSSSGISIAPNYRDVQSNPNNVFSCVGAATSPEIQNSELTYAQKIKYVSIGIGICALSAFALSVICGAFYCFCMEQNNGYIEGKNQDPEDLEIEVDDNQQLIQE